MSRPTGRAAGATAGNRAQVADLKRERIGGAPPDRRAMAEAEAAAADMEAKQAEVLATDVANDGPITEWHGTTKNEVYEWRIPSDVSGYELHLLVKDCATPDLARTHALQRHIPDQRHPAGERALTPLESRWIEATPPQVVRDTRSVLLDHNGAMRENERNYALLTAYRATRKLLADEGIDINNPQAWVDAKIEVANAIVRDHQTEADHKHQLLANALMDAQNAIRTVLRATGFAPPEPVALVEPAYDRLSVYAVDGVNPVDYPRLARANWITVPPTEPLTADEEWGQALILGDGHVLDTARRRGSMGEARAIQAITARIVALLGAPKKMEPGRSGMSMR